MEEDYACFTYITVRPNVHDYHSSCYMYHSPYHLTLPTTLITHPLPTFLDPSCCSPLLSPRLACCWICGKVWPEKRIVELRLNLGIYVWGVNWGTPGTIKQKVCCSTHSFQMRLNHLDSVASSLCFSIS